MSKTHFQRQVLTFDSRRDKPYPIAFGSDDHGIPALVHADKFSALRIHYLTGGGGRRPAAVLASHINRSIDTTLVRPLLLRGKHLHGFEVPLLYARAGRWTRAPRMLESFKQSTVEQRAS